MPAELEMSVNKTLFANASLFHESSIFAFFISTVSTWFAFTIFNTCFLFPGHLIITESIAGTFPNPKNAVASMLER